MKYHRIIYVLLTIVFLFSACSDPSANESEMQQENAVTNSDTEVFQTSSEPVDSKEDMSKTNENITSDTENGNSGNSFGEYAVPTYSSWADFAANEKNHFNHLLNFGKITEVINIEQVMPASTTSQALSKAYRISSHDCKITVYPLVSDEEKTYDPWYYITRTRPYMSSFPIYTNLDDCNISGAYAYKYTKEGIELYAVSYTSDVYDICFRIGDYIFSVSSSKYRLYTCPGFSFMPQEVYEKLKPEFEGNMGFYDIADFSNDKSELIRVLKEIVAEAEQNGEVTE